MGSVGIVDIDHAFDLDRFFRENIPVTQAMGIRLDHIDENGLTLSVPREPNIEEALLARHQRRADVVIARSEQVFRRPGIGDLCAVCKAPKPAAQNRFLQGLSVDGKAKWWLDVSVLSEQVEIARFKSECVGLSLMETLGS